ncbi:hypothetical protein [Gelidibacter pelagius]|uniref:DUF4919 domain-containing protein n=1 Tax=Gelidibacter pelagius TaxID=2819985 RepID=A0ABS3STY3_9FLAO|nr:hypothetical protein [Gelidibacter pelagius]MBO3099147.1 hypothetical protein [Gelidibacter pelagius]
MSKLLLLMFFPLCTIAQHVDFENMSDEQLQFTLEKELLDMEHRGATPPLIFAKFIVETDQYIQSREAYYRFVVHLNYVADKMLAMKMENGSDTASDFERSKKLKNHKTYQDYVNYRKIDKAREHWENSTQDGILKLVVANHEQFTKAEQKRFDGLIILLNRDPYFTHLNITDGKITKRIMPNIN